MGFPIVQMEDRGGGRRTPCHTIVFFLENCSVVFCGAFYSRLLFSGFFFRMYHFALFHFVLFSHFFFLSFLVCCTCIMFSFISPCFDFTFQCCLLFSFFICLPVLSCLYCIPPYLYFRVCIFYLLAAVSQPPYRDPLFCLSTPRSFSFQAFTFSLFATTEQ